MPGQGDGGELGAAGRGTITDGGEAIRQGDGGEGGAAGRGTIADGGEATGQGDGGLVGSGQLACTTRSLAW